MNQKEYIEVVARREEVNKKINRIHRIKTELQYLKKSLSDEEYNQVWNKIIDANDLLTEIKLSIVEVNKE